MAHSATSTRQSVAAVGAVAVGVLFLVIAVLGVVQGISALLDDPYPAAPPPYSYRLTPSIWGWVHVSYSILLAAVGVALIAGAAWGRVAAIVIAAATMVANFLWLPHAPAWATLMIVVCAVAVWAVATWQPDQV
ncbi:MAG: hypothetical protein HOQ36_23610 [Nocardia sp.]|nr:hypothetical protein [Nocardia sp.]NUS95364.1 hypothetical protein [Nocardia sp.]